MNVIELLAQARPATLDAQPDPARRASDLAAAFSTSQEGQRRARRGPARRAVPFGIGVTALAAAAAAAVAVTHAGTPAITRHPQAGPTADRAMQSAILTAFDGLAGDILHVHTVGGGPARAQDTWYSPWWPSGGQHVRMRSYVPGQQDVEFVYDQPSSASALSVNGEAFDVEYGTRTWSDQKSTRIAVKPQSGSPAIIRKQIDAGNYSVAGKAEIGGRPAIELVGQDPTGLGTVHMWLDATTYTLLKASFDDQSGGTVTSTYTFLAPTAANLAKLRPVIPAGFTRTATQELPPSQNGGKG
jgi:hypothetical protein